ncbi:MAG: ASCH domain-containing protein [Pseudomonadota bacterium]
MAPDKSPATEAFWQAYKRATGAPERDYQVAAFGDMPDLRDELAALAAAGTKRATAALRRDFDDETLPKVGDLVVLLDGSLTPVFIWRTTEITIKPMNQVDAAFAWDEGEGARTVESWLADHRAYFADQARHEGFQMHDDIELVFERFKVVWPPELADPDR